MIAAFSLIAIALFSPLSFSPSPTLWERGADAQGTGDAGSRTIYPALTPLSHSVGEGEKDKGEKTASNKPLTYRLNNGARLVVLPEPDADTVAIQVFFRVGLADEKKDRSINALIARAWGRESENRIAALLRADVGRVGGIGTDFADDWVSIWGLSRPDDFQKSCQTLLTNLVGNPLFSAEALARAKTEQIRSLALDRDRLTVEVQDRLRVRAFGASPYGQLPQGDEADLSTLTPETLTAYYHRLFRPGRCVIAVAGKIDPEEAKRLVEAALGAGGWNDRPDAPAPPRIVAQQIPDNFREQILPRRAPATVFALGLLAPGTEAGRTEYAALLLLDAVLGGGKSGRLFARLRDGETEPVGYDIKTLLTPNRAQSLWTVFVVGESAMKTSRDAITAEFNALADGTRPITAEELTRAKNYLKVRHQQGRQRLKERAFGIGWAETMGLDAAFDTDYAARLDTISLDDVNRMARRVLGGPPAIVYSLPFPKATPEPAATPEPMP